MKRAAWLQDRRMRKFRDVLSRWNGGDLSMMEAGELLGMSERQVRRYRDRYEEAGDAGLLDRRLGKLSTRRVPAEAIEEMLELYRHRNRGWNVKHFHEHLLRDHNFSWGYTFIKTQLHAAGLVDRAKRRGAHRRKRERKPCEGMMLHQDGSRHEWLVTDVRPDRDDGRRHEHAIFGFPDCRGRHGVELSGTFGDLRQGPAFEPLHRSRQPLFRDAEGRRSGRQEPTDAGRTGAQAARHRAYPGLFA
ncbi:MAG: helix-turn-helix domain-containing protein [Mesorhizobium sp.]|nr:MAG: helix-turn-helix domain-containing protein [Mesorhizobium sp.]